MTGATDPNKVATEVRRRFQRAVADAEEYVDRTVLRAPTVVEASESAYSQQMGVAVILTGLLLGAGLVGFFLGIGATEPVCVEAEVIP